MSPFDEWELWYFYFPDFFLALAITHCCTNGISDNSFELGNIHDNKNNYSPQILRQVYPF